MQKVKEFWRRVAQLPRPVVRSRAIWTGALLFTVLAEPVLERSGWANSGLTSQAGASKAGAAAALPDPALALSQRSPGARGAGGMLQTKNRLAATGGKAATPHEQVLPNIRYAPPGFPAPTVPDIIPGILNPVVPAIIAPSQPGPPFAPPPVPPSVVPIPPVGPVSSGGGGPVPPGTPTPPPGPPAPPPPPPPVSPVPEPSTWAMLIVGMAFAGAGLRSAQRRQAHGRTLDTTAPRDGSGGTTTVAGSAD